jgi:TonB family protein
LVVALALSAAIHAVGIPVGWWGVRMALMSSRDSQTVSGITVTLVEVRTRSALVVEGARLTEDSLPVPDGRLGSKDFLTSTIMPMPEAETTSGRVLDADVPLPGDAGVRTDQETKIWCDAPLLIPDAPAGPGEAGMLVPLATVPDGTAGYSSGGAGAGSASGRAGTGSSSGGDGASGSSDAADMVFTADVHPRYPVGARMRGEQGAVTVEVEVDGAGKIVAASVIQSSSHEALDQAALDAVRRARFISRRSGKPADGRIVLTIRFQLTE